MKIDVTTEYTFHHSIRKALALAQALINYTFLAEGNPWNHVMLRKRDRGLFEKLHNLVREHNGTQGSLEVEIMRASALYKPTNYYVVDVWEKARDVVVTFRSTVTENVGFSVILTLKQTTYRSPHWYLSQVMWDDATGKTNTLPVEVWSPVKA